MTPNNYALALSVMDRSHPQFPDLDVMIKSVLGYYRRTFRWVDPQDLTQAAWIGMFEGALRFDPKRGVQLKTYSEYYVRKSVQRELTLAQEFLDRASSLDRVCNWASHEPAVTSLEVSEFLKGLTATQQTIAVRIMDGQTPAEISREFGVSKPRISAVIKRMKQIWLKDSVRQSVGQASSIN